MPEPTTIACVRRGKRAQDRKADDMDPATAMALAIKAVAEMITEIVKGQPPEVKAQAWAWWQQDMERWRKVFKIEN